MIAQHHPLPGPEILDLGTSGREILFDGIQFVRTRFEGEFKAEWFTNNHFEDCVFSTEMTQAMLEGKGNRVETSVWVRPPAMQ
jgi:hypothetical protein